MQHPYKNLENFTLPSLLERSIKLYSHRDSFGFVGESAMSYAEFNEKIQKMVFLLRKNGITKGDKVLLLSENMPHWGVAYFATTYFGAVIVPVLPDFHPSDVHHIIRHSEAKAIFVSERHLSTIEESEHHNINFVISLDNLKLIDELTHKHHKVQEPKEVLQKPLEDDFAALIYTSGTTGHSKGVMLSHKNLTTNAVSSYSKVTIFPTDVFLSILPLAHTLECTVGFLVPLLHGSSVYYVNKAPTPSVLLKAFEIVRPTMMLSVPLIIEKIYKNKILPKFTGSFIMRTLYSLSFIRKILNKIAGKKLIETFGGRMRFFGIGGAGLSPHVEEFLIEAKFPYIIGYGLTETSPLIAGSILGEKVKLRSTGTAFPDVIIKIKDKNPETGEGEIIIQSPGLMMGYYKDEEKTHEVIKDGWFYTGDLGHMDEEGFLFISGRSKNVIIGSGGENIYPEQLESIINENEAVLDALVLEQNGKLVARIHLDYELMDKMFHADKMPDAQVRENIAQYLEKMRIEINAQVSSFSKIAKFIEQIEPFVKTPTKKIKRYLYTE
ncbi:MAG: long-chain fatty acid--CoA ligase [Sulfurimonas sp.]|nr:long-chain fatty acid--CoA ligase [Sulfurimonas sp.]MBU1216163.1 AMP-binding protein [bacterium]MBU1434469.1 AMP-binding protein [bacterium]MBU1502047.1 AMP-binding protein [bacterium]MBU3939271.1 AMP-binding protein [bacterium]